MLHVKHRARDRCFIPGNTPFDYLLAHTPCHHYLSELCIHFFFLMAVLHNSFVETASERQAGAAVERATEWVGREGAALTWQSVREMKHNILSVSWWLGFKAQNQSCGKGLYCWGFIQSVAGLLSGCCFNESPAMFKHRPAAHLSPFYTDVVQ